MKVDILLGLQWGDEGKGKIVDFIGKKYNLIGRFKEDRMLPSIKFNNQTHVLHTIPSGIFQKKTENLMETVLLLIQLFSLMNYQI